MYWLGTDVAYTLTYWPTANAVALASKFVVNDLLPSPNELEPDPVNPEYPNPEYPLIPLNPDQPDIPLNPDAPT